MATANSIEEARNWIIAGIAYDLVAIHGTEDLTTIADKRLSRRENVSDLKVGDHVVACVRGDMRNAIVSKVARTKVSVTYVTASSVRQIEKIGYGTISTSTTTPNFIWS